MRATIISLSLLAAAASASLLGTACSSSSGSGATPTISFSKDVMPIFEHSCGLSSSCHGDPSDVAARGIFLGCDMSLSPNCTVANPGPRVYADLVSGSDGGGPLPPHEIDGMPYITPGDPTKSYLMHKMDGDLASLSGCKANNTAVAQAGDTPGSAGTNMPPNWCGTFMPYNVQLLPEGPACGGSSDCTKNASYTRDTVRAWISQGALNN